MGRKALVVTLSALLLLLSLFALTLVFFHRHAQLRSAQVDAQLAEKLGFVEDDIVGGSYAQLLNISAAGISRQGGIVLVNFSGLRLHAADPEAVMAAYRSAVQGAYARQNNLNITLSGFVPVMNVTPYRSAITINRSDVLMANNESSLSGLTIIVKTDEAAYGSLEEDLAAGSVAVRFVLLNRSGDVLYDTAGGLDPAVQSKLKFDFGGARRLQLLFGQFGSQEAGTALLSSTIPVEVRTLLLQLVEQPAPVALEGGMITIATAARNVTRSSRVILAEE